MKRYFLSIFVIFMAVIYSSGAYYSENLLETTLYPPETIDTETLTLGIPNRLILNPFNIFINPAQITQWGTVYGEIWDGVMSWGGVSVKSGKNKLGVFLGRPYIGKVTLTGTLPLGTLVTALPSGFTALPLPTDPTGATASMYDLSVYGIGGNHIDIIYGIAGGDIAYGFGLSCARNAEEIKYSYQDQFPLVNAAGEGKIINKQSSNDIGISAGLLMKNKGSIESIDLSMTVSMPKVSNSFYEEAYASPVMVGKVDDKLNSNNGLNFDLLGRVVIPEKSGKFIASARVLVNDVSAKRTRIIDTDATTAGADVREIKYSDTGNSVNFDIALHTHPVDKLKIIYSAGFANFSRNIDVLESEKEVPAGIADGNLFEEKGRYKGIGFPVAISVEHQTWSKVSCRFSASTSLLSNATVELTGLRYFDTNGDGVNDNPNESIVKDAVDPRRQMASVGLGLGIKPVDRVTIDLAIVANIFDLNAGGADLITGASLKYNF